MAKSLIAVAQNYLIEQARKPVWDEKGVEPLFLVAKKYEEKQIGWEMALVDLALDACRNFDLPGGRAFVFLHTNFLRPQAPDEFKRLQAEWEKVIALLCAGTTVARFMAALKAKAETIENDEMGLLVKVVLDYAHGRRVQTPAGLAFAEFISQGSKDVLAALA